MKALLVLSLLTISGTALAGCESLFNESNNQVLVVNKALDQADKVENEYGALAQSGATMEAMCPKALEFRKAIIDAANASAKGQTLAGKAMQWCSGDNSTAMMKLRGQFISISETQFEKGRYLDFLIVRNCNGTAVFPKGE